MANLFEGKTAVVTGGSSGIGEGLARWLAEEGANIVLAARNRTRLKKAVEALRGIRPDGSYLTVRANIRAESQVESLKAKTLAAFDTVDILINNAGIGAWHEIVDMPTRDWNAVIETNLTGVFFGDARLFAAHDSARVGAYPEHLLGRRQAGLQKRLRLLRFQMGAAWVHPRAR